MIVAARRRIPAGANYRRRGFGLIEGGGPNPFNSQGTDVLPVAAGGTQLVATPGYAVCDPLDPTCVAGNENLSTQYGLNVQRAQAQNNFNQCADNAQNATSPAQYAAAMAACNGQAAAQSGGQPINTTAPPPPPAAIAPAAVPVAAPAPAAVYMAPAATTTPAGAVVINSSGATQPAAVAPAAPSSGFDWSSPWVLGAAAAVALLAFGGSGGR